MTYSYLKSDRGTVFAYCDKAPSGRGLYGNRTTYDALRQRDVVANQRTCIVSNDKRDDVGLSVPYATMVDGVYLVMDDDAPDV